MERGQPGVESLLTRLVGGRDVGRDALSRLSADDWDALDERAAEHRVQPLLHAQWAGGPLAEAIPESIRTSWSRARRASAMRALQTRAELLETVRTLEAAGIPAIALKGSWLAWFAYPSPELRPMRDIDLLVPAEDAVRAWDALLAAGHEPDEPPPEPIEELARRYKHLPPLIAPRGTCIELHTRLWDRDGRTPGDLAGLAGRAIAPEPESPLRYLGLEDLFAHLCVHAIVSHRLDCGPQLLVDIDLLVEKAAFDWPALWRRARDEGWMRPAALTLALVDRWRRPGILSESRCPLEPPADLVEGSPALMCKPVSARAEDIATAKLVRADVTFPEKLRRIAVKRREMPSTGAYLGWLSAQAAGAASGLLRPDGRDRGRRIDSLERWLAAR